MVLNNKLIELVDVVKCYDGETVAVDHMNLYIREHEFVTLLGPSGCGKTTTLRMIAGFEQLTSGKVLLNGADMTSMPPYKRPVNTVFQRYVLFPFLNVEDNIAFGLKIQKMDKKQIAVQVGEVLELVGLSGFQKRKIDALSGGQQQRVAIARALVNRPKVLLLDEPLGALDLKLRKEMQIELKKMQQSLGITFVYVTHDQEEALTMSDTIVVMNRGEIQQIGTPQDIYNEPINSFVADFIGESNIMPGIMRGDYKVEFAGHVFPCVDSGWGSDKEVTVVVRPEDIIMSSPETGMIQGTVRDVIFKGVHYESIVDGSDGFEWMVHSTQMCPPGSGVGLSLAPDSMHVMAKEE